MEVVLDYLIIGKFFYVDLEVSLYVLEVVDFCV